MTHLQNPKRLAAAALVAMFALPVHAQMATFKNFKRYPSAGQWQQELVGYRDGKAMGPPAVTKTCASPFDANAVPPGLQAARNAAPSCTTKVITDQAQLAEFETVCKMPAGLQTLHTTLRPIDDQTLSSEVRSTMAGQPQTLMKSKVTYLGPCSAEEAVAARKPSPEDCAALAQMRQDNAAAGGAAQCAQMPPEYRARCESQMAIGTKYYAALEKQCK